MMVGENKRTKNKPSEISMPRPDWVQIIDTYFSNGFNGVQAVLSVYPDKPYQQARNMAGVVLNSDKSRPYIAAKREQLGREAEVQPNELIKELKQIAYADVSNYIGLTPDEVKQLPPEMTRPLKKITVKEKTYTKNDGSQITDKTIVYEIEDRLKAIDSLSKVIGLYEIDNRQKATNINLTKLDIGTLNNLLQVIEQGEG